jgi:hypothetical protein
MIKSVETRISINKTQEEFQKTKQSFRPNMTTF